MGVYFRGRSWCESGSVWIPGASIFFSFGIFIEQAPWFSEKKKKMHWAACQGQWPGQEAIRLMTPRILSSACWVIVFIGSRHLAPSLQPRWLLPQISTNGTSQASRFPCYSVGGAGGAGAGASFSSGMRGWRACRVAPLPSIQPHIQVVGLPSLSPATSPPLHPLRPLFPARRVKGLRQDSKVGSSTKNSKNSTVRK